MDPKSEYINPIDIVVYQAFTIFAVFTENNKSTIAKWDTTHLKWEGINSYDDIITIETFDTSKNPIIRDHLNNLKIYDSKTNSWSPIDPKIGHRKD